MECEDVSSVSCDRGRKQTLQGCEGVDLAVGTLSGLLAVWPGTRLAIQAPLGCFDTGPMIAPCLSRLGCRGFSFPSASASPSSLARGVRLRLSMPRIAQRSITTSRLPSILLPSPAGLTTVLTTRHPPSSGLYSLL
jgi:hypothetical protein